MRRGHNYVGWREAKRWRCVRCGRCCKAYAVPLKFVEALQLTRKYGPVAIQAGGKYYLMKKPDDSCIFLTYNGPVAYCKIYLERPGCCKLYPFHVARKPLQGIDPSSSEVKIGGKVIHVYVDASCPGVGVGFQIKNLIPKVVELWSRYSRMI